MKNRQNKQTSTKQISDSKVQTNVKEVLLWKKVDLLKNLREIDTIISEAQQNYSLRMEQLQDQKKPLEYALYHVEALLRFEGDYTNNGLNITYNSATPATIARTSITDAAFNLLEELHQPMHYKDIAAKLQKRNIYIPGKNPAATLLSRISRDDRLKRTQTRGVYALSTWQVTNANSTEILIDNHIGNIEKVIRNGPPDRPPILFTQPWEQVSFLALGICYGKG